MARRLLPVRREERRVSPARQLWISLTYELIWMRFLMS